MFLTIQPESKVADQRKVEHRDQRKVEHRDQRKVEHTAERATRVRLARIEEGMIQSAFDGDIASLQKYWKGGWFAYLINNPLCGRASTFLLQLVVTGSQHVETAMWLIDELNANINHCIARYSGQNHATRNFLLLLATMSSNTNDEVGIEMVPRLPCPFKRWNEVKTQRNLVVHELTVLSRLRLGR
jgi:hypothetical protein